MVKKQREKRKTLDQIPHYPTPKRLYKLLKKSKGWPYKTKKELYRKRDLSLPSLLYLGDLRISEALPIKKNQFSYVDDYLLIEEIKLSKRRKGNVQFREARLPLEGERACFTKLIEDYLELLKPEQRLYPWSLKKKLFVLPDKFDYVLKDGTVKHRVSHQIVGTTRAWQIINHMLPQYTQHWLRAFGYNYDYDVMDHDLLAVSDKTKVDPRSLQPYLRRRYEKYPVR